MEVSIRLVKVRVVAEIGNLMKHICRVGNLLNFEGSVEQFPGCI